MSNLPWGVHTFASMIGGADTATHLHNGQIVRAVPLPYQSSFIERMQAAWWVLTGKAEAVIWPKPGQLEWALDR